MTKDVNLDVNELLDSLSAEIANATRRAVIAEATSAARQRRIRELEEETSALNASLAELEAQLDQAKNVAKPEEMPDFG